MERGSVMGIANFLEEKIIDFLDKRVGVDARMQVEETEEQQLQRRTDIRRALEQMRRQERIMARRS